MARQRTDCCCCVCGLSHAIDCMIRESGPWPVCCEALIKQARSRRDVVLHLALLYYILLWAVGSESSCCVRCLLRPRTIIISAGNLEKKRNAGATALSVTAEISFVQHHFSPPNFFSRCTFSTRRREKKLGYLFFAIYYVCMCGTRFLG